MSVRTPAGVLAPLALISYLAGSAPATADIPLDRLPDLAAAATDRQGHAILSAERERLRLWRRSLRRTGEIFDRECARVRRGSAAEVSCRARLGALQSQGHAFNAAVAALTAQLAAIRRGETSMPEAAWAVRDPALVEGGTRDALRAANQKTAYVLLALDFGAGDWQASLRFLRGLLAYGPGPRDGEIREAIAYVEGMYGGWLASARMSNLSYRQGIRRWLAGDATAAARAFAQAARDDPDDLKIYATFAHTVGRQHESAECVRDRRCLAGDLPRWASFFGPRHRATLEALRLGGARQPAPARRLLAYLEGMAVYAAHPRTRQRSRPPAAQALADRAISRFAAGDVAGAARLYARAWEAGESDRALLYLRHYSEGILAARGRDLPNALDSAVEAETFRELYEASMAGDLERLEARRAEGPGFAARTFARLRAAFRDVAANSPFFGRAPAPPSR